MYRALRNVSSCHNAAHIPNAETPASQRSRSLMYLAYGVLAATSTARYQDGQTVDLYVCENGFIGLNPPLTPARVGSLSTRTTHPVVFAHFRSLLAALGLRVNISNPYQAMTKGEMLLNCKNQELLGKFASKSTSCGRFKTYSYQHCGRCGSLPSSACSVREMERCGCDSLPLQRSGT